MRKPHRAPDARRIQGVAQWPKIEGHRTTEILFLRELRSYQEFCKDMVEARVNEQGLDNKRVP